MLGFSSRKKKKKKTSSCSCALLLQFIPHSNLSKKKNNTSTVNEVVSKYMHAGLSEVDRKLHFLKNNNIDE